jgi:PAS domain S-box-containing protein
MVYQAGGGSILRQTLPQYQSTIPGDGSSTFDVGRTARFAVCFGALFLFFCSITISSRAEGLKQVVIVHPYQSALPATAIADAAIRRRLQAHLPDGVSIFTEFLDAERFPGPEQDARMEAFLRGKYAKRPIDLLIATGPKALDFLMQRRGTLFADAQLIFGGMSDEALKARTLPAGVTGVVSKYNLAATMDLALQLQPDTRRVVVVTGASVADRGWQERARSMLGPYAARLNIQYLSGLSVPELLRQVAELPKDAIVFYLAIFEDGAGNAFLPVDVAEKLGQAANVPIYGIFDTYLGRGIVGGHMDSFEATGTSIADLALSVMAGKRPDAFPNVPSANFVDWRQLQRWGLREANLPKGTVVLYREPSLWGAYWWQILFVAALVVVQFVLIVALSLQGRRRRRAEFAARENEERVNLATASGNLGLWQWDAENDRLWVSEVCRQILGLAQQTDLMLTTFLALVHREDLIKAAPPTEFTTNAKNADTPEHFLICPDGSERWIRAIGRTRFDPSGQPARITGVIIDVTAYKLAERETSLWRQELMHLTRVATLGELSWAMAHELNQPLTAILSNADAARFMVAAKEFDIAEVRHILSDIVADATRGGEIIRHLRALFAKTEALIQPLFLNEIVTEVLRLVHSDLVVRRIIVTSLLAPQLPMVRGDRVQLQQVLLNLIFNACEAMTDNEPGERVLTLTTAPDGRDAAKISVADRGSGISADVSDKLFKPFVSTKSRGLGLGLSICRSIVEAHGGRLWAFNGPERGATFCIALPADDGA